eukprot:1056391-Prymnesium_polylepis.1
MPTERLPPPSAHPTNRSKRAYDHPSAPIRVPPPSAAWHTPKNSSYVFSATKTVHLLMHHSQP